MYVCMYVSTDVSVCMYVRMYVYVCHVLNTNLQVVALDHLVGGDTYIESIDGIGTQLLLNLLHGFRTTVDIDKGTL